MAEKTAGKERGPSSRGARAETRGSRAAPQWPRWAGAWRRNYAWTAPGFLGSGVVAVGIYLLATRIGLRSLLFIPPVYLIYHSYRLYMKRMPLFAEKVQQDMAHIQELNKLNRAVIASLTAPKGRC